MRHHVSLRLARTGPLLVRGQQFLSRWWLSAHARMRLTLSLCRRIGWPSPPTGARCSKRGTFLPPSRIVKSVGAVPCRDEMLGIANLGVRLTTLLNYSIEARKRVGSSLHHPSNDPGRT
jgi:hypothetical protein